MTAGRHCAVAHLMRSSGDSDAVRQIAGTANLARIDDMDPVTLDSWACDSGLTKRELARIQPGYPHADQSAANLLLWSALVLIPLALLSFAIQLRRGVIRDDTGLLVTGAALGALMVLLASSYLVWGATLSEPEKAVDPTVPGMYGDLHISFALGSAALLTGLGFLATGVARRRRLA